VKEARAVKSNNSSLCCKQTVRHDDDEDDEGICRARHKQSSDALPISQTGGGPSDVEQTSEGRELQFAEWLVN